MQEIPRTPIMRFNGETIPSTGLPNNQEYLGMIKLIIGIPILKAYFIFLRLIQLVLSLIGHTMTTTLQAYGMSGEQILPRIPSMRPVYRACRTGLSKRIPFRRKTSRRLLPLQFQDCLANWKDR
ncbi:putative transmembrane protein [Myrmica scabrinodis virus 1]|uniref:Putative transmembrane protein n=1 Tax=Myrmica scabrinodis virus 1 TaxID=2018502 RepID=A0A220QTG1_9VIRU|nr:putative transmembrane protein [Myrmica scabrinodis virus 1]ASK12202.1 putative transmembrane protein [Myrmica scabrinodis virus 1]